MQTSKIEWTETSWNPIRGCTRVSEGCRHCYAESIAARFSDPGLPFHGFAERTPGGPRWTGKVELMPDKLTEPMRWKKPRRVFVNSMSDLFHETIPDDVIDRVFAVMALAGYSRILRSQSKQLRLHTFQVLTKRPARMRDYLTDPDVSRRVWLAARWLDPHRDGRTVYQGHLRPPGRWPWPQADLVPPEWPLPWVWLGVSVEDQETADARIPALIDTPAAVRWVSAEPLLGPIVLEDAGVDWLEGEHLDWLVCGGESGPGARPMHPDWARSLRDQCASVGTAFFLKQLGSLAGRNHHDIQSFPPDLRVREMPHA